MWWGTRRSFQKVPSLCTCKIIRVLLLESREVQSHAMHLLIWNVVSSQYQIDIILLFLPPPPVFLPSSCPSLKHYCKPHLLSHLPKSLSLGKQSWDSWTSLELKGPIPSSRNASVISGMPANSPASVDVPWMPAQCRKNTLQCLTDLTA